MPILLKAKAQPFTVCSPRTDAVRFFHSSCVWGDLYAAVQGTRESPTPTRLQVDPKGDHVYVKVADAEEQTLGGVLLPGSVQQRPTSGAVVSVGDGAMPSGKPLEFTVSTGDEVSITACLCNRIPFKNAMLFPQL